MTQSTVAAYLPYVVRGILVMLELLLFAGILMLASGLALASMRLSRFRTVRWVSLGIVEFFRGTSVIVQLFWAFYVLPFFGLSLAPTVAAVMVIGLNQGSYASEVVRNAFLEVSPGQRDAAFAVGYSRRQSSWLIVFPQAIGLMIAPLTNIMVSVGKMTSLASLVLVPDLTYRALSARSVTGASVEFFGLILALYLAVSLIISRSSQFLESRYYSGLLGHSVRRRGSALRLGREQT